jgi:phospholipid-binding lipoprotein MlaA
MLLGCMLMLALAGGCASQDPIEKVNRPIDSANTWLDTNALQPVATAYTKNVPSVVRRGIGNFFDNLAYPNVIVNDYLQANFAQGWRDTERLAVNTTIGVLGIGDPATRMGRPHNKNDFGITLGRWGTGAGPYLVVPLLGPSTLRDLPALVVARVTSPIFWLHPPLEVTLPLDVVSFVDQRASLQPAIDVRNRAALDPYTFTRDVYLQYRDYQIHGPTAAMEAEEAGPPVQGPGATNFIR